jgi:hypothetical protein
MPDILDVDSIEAPYVTPSTILKQIDSSFESFFHQRDYTERNFAFYLQVLA